MFILYKKLIVIAKFNILKVWYGRDTENWNSSYRWIIAQTHQYRKHYTVLVSILIVGTGSNLEEL